MNLLLFLLVALGATAAPARRPAEPATSTPGVQDTSGVVNLMRFSVAAGEGQVEGPALATPAARQRATMWREYPRLLRDAGVQGYATVQVSVDENGAVVPSRTRLLDASHELFQEGATRIANHMAFSPARVNGVAVPAEATLHIRFLQHP
jgi:TonB family protein